jgi:molecular chaperone GrpE
MSADPDSNSTETKSDADAGSNPVSGPDKRMLQTELAVERDRNLRLVADFDNFRKRTAREIERSAAAQKEAFIRELLPVIDQSRTRPWQRRFDLARTTSSRCPDDPPQLTQLLRLHGIEPEESLGRPFDPLYHEAVSVRHDPSQPHHVILETLQRGYRRGNEVFRPAKVVVNDLSHADSGRRAD